MHKRSRWPGIEPQLLVPCRSCSWVDLDMAALREFEQLQYQSINPIMQSAQNMLREQS